MSTRIDTPAAPGSTYRKIAVAEPTRRRLRTEAATLRRAAHPGIVRLTSLVDGHDQTELQTARAGDATLLTTSPPDASAALACAAGLAATVADLHQLGVVHARLTPDHVVIAPGGRPVLCGFGDAREGDTEVDIRALGTLFELLATGIPNGGASRRDRRLVARLLATAEHARTAMPPPTAAELATRLGAVPTRTSPRAAHPDVPRRVAYALATAFAVVAIFGIAQLFGSDLSSPQSYESGAPTEPPTTATLQPDAPAPNASPSSAAPTTTAARPEPATFRVGGAAFEVGHEGDIVVTGDWDCDGTPGAALLRPGTGEVFAFDVLATPGTPVTGRLVTTLPDARGLEAIDQPGGCTTLLARRADDGSPETLTVSEP